MTVHSRIPVGDGTGNRFTCEACGVELVPSGNRWVHRNVTAEIWTTRVVTVETPRGPRYQGVCYVGEGTPTYGKLPRGAQVRYTTRLHRSANEAREQARSRTIHHNVFHDGGADAAVLKHHRGIRCAEGSVRS